MQPGTYLIHLRVSDGQPFLSFDDMTLTVRDDVAPSARAGIDVTTVERATVVLDASSSTDPEGDELHYAWSLRTQPVAGAAPASGQGRTFSFAPTTPGNYTYRLTVSDAFGSSYDEVSIFVDRLIGFTFSSAVTIDPTTTSAQITRTVPINTSSYYSGSPVALSVSTNVPWLDIVSAPAQTGPNAVVVVTIDTAELASMTSGDYVGTLTVSPAGYGSRSAELLMMLSLPQVEHIAPYVTYTGRPTPMTLYGTHLHQTLGATLVINGTQVQGFSEAMAEHTRIVLPPLAAGEYDLRIANNLGVVQPMGRLVVRDAPTYPDGEFAISGRVESLEYDSERDAFYVVSWDLDYGHKFEAYRLRFDGVQWQRDAIPVTAPLAVALARDGTTLFVTTENCGIQELDPNTFQVRQASTKPSCYYESFGMVAGLANGRTIVGDTNQWPTVFDYPSLSTSTIPFPSVHTPVHALNRSHERLLWAESPTISAPQELYSYDVRTNGFTQISVHDPETYFLAPLLALSGDGRRIMHRADVYEDAQYIGSLQGTTSGLLSPALTSTGDRAVVLNPDTNIVSLFDLSSGPNFPKITDVATLPADVGSGRVVVLPGDNAAAVFTTTFPPSGGYGFRLYVRNLP